MKMVDMDITRFCFFGPKTRSVNIFLASKYWTIYDVAFFFENDMSLRKTEGNQFFDEKSGRKSKFWVTVIMRL